MKSQRLEHKVFIEALGDCGLVDREVLNHVFEQAVESNELVCEILVREDLISDYELANVACVTFGLPFLHVFSYTPNEAALEGLDPDFLRSFGLVPLDRYGEVLTVAMPGMVPAAVLEVLTGETVKQVLPIVGSVVANREWLEQHLPDPNASDEEVDVEELEAALPTTADDPASEVDEWAAIFDAGEEAVQFSLQSEDEEGLDQLEVLEPLDDGLAALEEPLSPLPSKLDEDPEPAEDPRIELDLDL